MTPRCSPSTDGRCCACTSPTGRPAPTARPGAVGRGGRPVSPARVTSERNPLRDPHDRRLPRIAGPCGLVIFGVTGDLSRKKLMPAVYDLANRGLLPPGFALVGFARRDWADQDFAQVVHDVGEGARPHPVPRAVWNASSPRASGSSRATSTTTWRSTSSRTVDELDRRAAPAATTRSTCRCRRSSFPDVVPAARGARPLGPVPPRATPGAASWSRSRSGTTSRAPRS